MASKNGNRKHGRNSKVCQRYFNEGRRDKARTRRMVKHLTRYGPHDMVALDALKKVSPGHGKHWEGEHLRLLPSVLTREAS